MPAREVKRPNFYEGQYLGAADLIAAQEYQRQQDQRHRLAAHTWGIAAGLELDERAQPGSSSAVDVFIKPGYAVDGFGRTIVVLEPFKIPEALFAQFTIGSGPPDGHWIPVWLRYCEQKTNPAGPGFVICDVEEQAYRVLETFRIVVGELLSTSQQRDQITVAGRMVDAEIELPDASVPYQALPESGDADRWLIPVGSVRWLAPIPPATAGHFVKSVSDNEKKKAREGRQYFGVVAESVLAPTGKLRIRDRKNPKPLVPETPELMGVEGSLRVDGISHFRDLLITDSYANIDSQNLNNGNPTPLNGLGGPALTFGFISFEGIASQRQGAGNVNGLDFYTRNAPRLSITNGGNVGIGTRTPGPGLKLDIKGDFGRDDGPATIHLWGSRIGDQGDNTLLIQGGVGGNVKFDATWVWVQQNLFVGGLFANFSDERLKTSIRPLTNVLAKIQQIHGYSYEWNETYATLGFPSAKKQIGLLAKEVEKVFPELVIPWGEQNYLGLDYARLTTVLLEAIKELAEQNETLGQRIKSLEKSYKTQRKLKAERT